MSEEQDRQDQLLDLLYGELSPQEEERLRQALQEDPVLMAQLQELRADREAICEHLPLAEPVPEDVAGEILAMARKEGPSPQRRHPSPGDRPQAHARRTTLVNLQAVGSVLAVMLCFGVVTIILFGETIDEMFMEAEQEVSAISFTGYGGTSGSGGGGGRSNRSFFNRPRSSDSSSAPVHRPPAEVSVAEEESEYIAPLPNVGRSAEPERLVRDEAAPQPQPQQHVERRRAAPAPQEQAVAADQAEGTLRQERQERSVAPQRSAAPRPQPRSQASSPMADSLETTQEDQVTRQMSSGRSAPSSSVVIDGLGAAESAAAYDREIAAEAEGTDQFEDESSVVSTLDDAEAALADGQLGTAERLIEEALEQENLSAESQERARRLRSTVQERRRQQREPTIMMEPTSR